MKKLTKKQKLTTLNIFFVLLGFLCNQYALLAVNSFGSHLTKLPYAWIFIIIALIATALALAVTQKQNKNVTVNGKWYYSGLFVLAFYIYYLLMMMILTALGLNATQSNQETLATVFKNNEIIIGLSTVLIAPVTEEIIFRELLPQLGYPFLDKKWNKYNWVFYAISALLFTILHSPAGIMGWVSYGSLAIFFTLVRIYSNSVNTSIITHMLWNGIVVSTMLMS